jgi:putative colanic acid biosynthesis acetyltransferase WcaF
VLNVEANRSTQKYTPGEQFRRVLWSLAQPLFRWSPRPLFGWRRFLLRLFGAKIGQHVHIYSSTRIYFPWNLRIADHSAIGENALIYNLGPITIGQRVTISHGAHLCAGTHDYTDPAMPLLKPPITVGDDAWICADAFIGPGVHVGEGGVVGARAVAMRDVEPWTVIAGNPAQARKKLRIMRPRESVEQSRREDMP